MKNRNQKLIGCLLFIVIIVSIPKYYAIDNITTKENIYRVDDEGDGDFLSIQTAIDIAQPGDTIEVYSGHYEENIIIQQPQLTIKGILYELGSGDDTDHPVIVGLGSEDVIRINAEETILSGFIIQNSGNDYFDAGIGIYKNNNMIKANGITGNFYGIVINNCSQNTIKENYILSNTMDGIYLFYTQQNTITSNTIKENGFQGIYMQETRWNQIEENTISLNGKDGIHLRDKCIDNIIEKNTISSNDIDGIKSFFNENTNNLIKKNNIFSNGWNGIHFLFGEKNEIVENEIELNLLNGIHLGESDDNTIIKNTIKENQNEGIMILFDTSTNNNIYHNNIISDNAVDYGDNNWDNGDNGGNYWSYYSGDDNDGDGFGDTPYVISGSDNQDNYPFMNKLIAPGIPQRPRGPTLGSKGETYSYTTQASTNNQVQFGWDWNGDLTVDEWTDFFDSNQPCTTSHIWETNGSFQIYVKAMDRYGFQSDWSDPLSVTMPKQNSRFDEFLNQHPIILKILVFIIDALKLNPYFSLL